MKMQLRDRHQRRRMFVPTLLELEDDEKFFDFWRREEQLAPGSEKLQEEDLNRLGTRVDTDVLVRARQWLRFYI